jgi:hypothetical protein
MASYIIRDYRHPNIVVVRGRHESARARTTLQLSKEACALLMVRFRVTDRRDLVGKVVHEQTGLHDGVFYADVQKVFERYILGIHAELLAQHVPGVPPGETIQVGFPSEYHRAVSALPTKTRGARPPDIICPDIAHVTFGIAGRGESSDGWWNPTERVPKPAWLTLFAQRLRSASGGTVRLDSYRVDCTQETTLYLYMAGEGQENNARAMYRLPYQRNLALILAWEARSE